MEMGNGKWQKPGTLTDDFRLTDDCDRRLPTVDCLTTATGDYRLSTV
jgi:hypothetical protein